MTKQMRLVDSFQAATKTNSFSFCHKTFADIKIGQVGDKQSKTNFKAGFKDPLRSSFYYKSVPSNHKNKQKKP